LPKRQMKAFGKKERRMMVTARVIFRARGM
jgi:hypothetical protein